MCDVIKHECGIALVRLLRPLEYYLSKYGSAFYGLDKLYLLMEKQHNRGQDGAGIASIKFDTSAGTRFINRRRSNQAAPIKDIFSNTYSDIQELCQPNPNRSKDVSWLKKNVPFCGELYMGHLRYGTFGNNDINNCHPFIRHNNWKTRNLVVAGNFNLTNVEELFDRLIEFGQHPIETSDTITVLERIGYTLDEENEKLYQKFRSEGHSKKEISNLIAEHIDVNSILKYSSEKWDGGYVIAGMFGHGDAFVMRDPNGIRPAFYYVDDEVAVVTSERPVIQTAFNIPIERIKEVRPGHAITIKKDGRITEEEFYKAGERKSCSFERIYFSRGTDKDIYQERKNLGRSLAKSVLEAVDYDFKNTVYSFIPNTAGVAFRGMVQQIQKICDEIKAEKILKADKKISPKELKDILDFHPRVEIIAVKDAKLRTFITEDNQRDDLVAHIYDSTYGVIKKGEDKLVILDDSIVRGTTLKKSILRILDRLGPTHIVVVSSAPQIRYPDCYGIDMAKLGDFIAFQAAIDLLKSKGKSSVINDVYRKCKAQENLPKEKIKNYVKEIYKPFSAAEISDRIASMLKPKKLNAELTIIYQSIEDLHESCPDNTGDWYFTGDYPTPGGNKVVNKSFINYIEGRDERGY